MRNPVNIREVSALGPDYLGFIFHPGSPRHCGNEGAAILSNILGDAVPVMVSVNMPEEELTAIAEEWGFGVVQLHGNESPELCSGLRNRGLKVWKAIPVGRELPDGGKISPFESAIPFEGNVDMLLFDTATKYHGGSGKKFDWHLLEQYRGNTPFMLSGGISPDDAAEILQLRLPGLAGVDINSRFEISPGLKDVATVSRFLSSLKQ